MLSQISQKFNSILVRKCSINKIWYKFLRIIVLFTKKLSINYKKYALWIRDQEKTYSGSRIRIPNTAFNNLIVVSVADPDANPDPPDPRVFGPPGSVSTSQRYGSGSCSGSESGSLYHAKIVRKTFITYYLVTLCDFLSLKNDVDVASSFLLAS
jgi:hypothetical protein